MTTEDAVAAAKPTALHGEKPRALRAIEMMLGIEDADINVRAYRTYHLRQQASSTIPIDTMLEHHANVVEAYRARGASACATA